MDSTEQRAPEVAPLHVFIVEGSQAVRERLEELVGSIEGADCAGSAATAAEAIGGIRTSKPDAVILDIGLAGGNGFEVIRLLRGTDPQIAIYVLSNFVMEPYQRLAAKLGAAGFFDKSTQIEQMRSVLAQRAAHRNAMKH